VQAFLCFKVYLETGDLEAAKLQIESITQCADFEEEYLKLACLESSAANAGAELSKLCLTLLYTRPWTLEELSPAKQAGILRNLIAVDQKLG
jgi:hypothetical protein